MANRGRRALGAALDTASALYGTRLTQNLEEQKERREFARKLEALGIEAGIKTGQLAPTFQGGQFRGFQQGQPSSFDPSTLGPGERATQPLPGGGTRTFVGQTPPDPLLGASRRASALKSLQDIERENAGLPQPRPATKGFYGLGARPKVGLDPRHVDTSTLRSQLFAPGQSGGGGAELGGGGGLDPATQSVLDDLQSGQATPEEFLAQEAELQAAGVDTEAIRRQLGL